MQREFDLPAAWARLAEMALWVVALFGAPAQIAQRLCFLRADRQAFLKWLAPLEALARRLLLIEAAALPPQNAPPAFVHAGRVASLCADKPRAALQEDSKQWRVVFHVGPPAPSPAVRGTAPAKTPALHGIETINNAAPLARRLEALLRVAQHRAPLVKRLAQKLRVHSQEKIARAFAPYRHHAFCAEALQEAQACADRALTNADTS